MKNRKIFEEWYKDGSRHKNIEAAWTVCEESYESRKCSFCRYLEIHPHEEHVEIMCPKLELFHGDYQNFNCKYWTQK